MWHCIECQEKLVFPDEKTGLPASKYWAERDETIFTIMPPEYVKVFCSPECSLTYYQKTNKTP